MGKLTGKIAMVVGGSSGIGASIASRLAKEGAKVAVCGIEKKLTEDLVQALKSSNYEATAYLMDVTNKKQVEQTIEEIVNQWQQIDILVNSAGICDPVPFLECTEEQWDRHIEVNLKGAFLISQQVAARMVQQNIQGAIVNVSSVNGLAVEADQAHYNASKGGLNLLTQSMALELAPYGIRANALCPGFIETRLTKSVIERPEAIQSMLHSIPMNRVGSPEEVADAALFLCTSDSRYVTGHCLVVDGGQLIKLS